MIDYLELGNGMFAIVDPDCPDHIRAHHWQYVGGYVGTLNKDKRNGSHWLLHRLLMNAQKGQLVDHINQDPLDNRMVNLRFVTPAQNMWNTGMYRNNTSGYKGITFHKPSKKWLPRICVNNKRINLGQFDCKHEAARVWDAAALKYHGEYAYQNFKEDRQDATKSIVG